MLTKLLPRRTEPISRSLSSVILSARIAPLAPLSACARSFPREDTSYNSIVRTGNTSGFVLYGQGIRSFTMSFTVVEEA